MISWKSERYLKNLYRATQYTDDEIFRLIEMLQLDMDYGNLANNVHSMQLDILRQGVQDDRALDRRIFSHFRTEIEQVLGRAKNISIDLTSEHLQTMYRDVNTTIQKLEAAMRDMSVTPLTFTA